MRYSCPNKIPQGIYGFYDGVGIIYDTVWLTSQNEWTIHWGYYNGV